MAVIGSDFLPRGPWNERHAGQGDPGAAATATAAQPSPMGARVEWILLLEKPTRGGADGGWREAMSASREHWPLALGVYTVVGDWDAWRRVPRTQLPVRVRGSGKLSSFHPCTRRSS